MKRLYLKIGLVLMAALAFQAAMVEVGQALYIADVEYFIDTDPGAGMGIPLDSADGVFDSASESLSGIVDLSRVSLGLHYVYVRAQDSEGHWGTPRRYTIEVRSPDSTVKTAEFFIDADPGNGMGIPFHAASGSFGSYSVGVTAQYDTTNLSVGSHRVFGRVQRSDGSWGQVGLSATLKLGANTPPTSNDKSVSTDEDRSVGIILSATDPDSDPLTYIVKIEPSHGVLAGVAPNITYTPITDYVGTDQFTFIVNDGMSDSNEATVSITINPVNDRPTADNKSATTDEDTPAAMTLTGSDVDGDSLTFSVLTNPSHGTLSGTAPNLTYTPASDFNGSDSFTFKVNDGKLDSIAATVAITVNPLNDPPTASNQSLTAYQGSSTSITLLAQDIDSTLLTYRIQDNPAFGSLSGTPPNVTYTPGSGFSGEDMFTFYATDGESNSNIAQVVIKVLVPTGSLRVRIYPKDAVNGGASWSVDGDGSWLQSGAIVRKLPAGQHSITFKDIPNWDPPEEMSVTIEKGSIKKVDAYYKKKLPVVDIAASCKTILENGGAPCFFNLSRSGDTSKALNVFYDVLGTGRNGVDFKRLSGKTTIPANKSEVAIALRPINDRIVERKETVGLTVKQRSSYVIGSQKSATVSILDDDAKIGSQ